MKKADYEARYDRYIAQALQIKEEIRKEFHNKTYDWPEANHNMLLVGNYLLAQLVGLGAEHLNRDSANISGICDNLEDEI